MSEERVLSCLAAHPLLPSPASCVCEARFSSSASIGTAWPDRLGALYGSPPAFRQGGQ